MGKHANRGSHALRIALPNTGCQKEIHLFAAVGIKAPHLICFQDRSSPQRPAYGRVATHSSDLVIWREDDAFRKGRNRYLLSEAHLCNLVRGSLVAETVTFQSHRLFFDPLGTQ